METLAERIKILEDKVQKLEGANLIKSEPRNPYESKSKKEITVIIPQKKENE